MYRITQLQNLGIKLLVFLLRLQRAKNKRWDLIANYCVINRNKDSLLLSFEDSGISLLDVEYNVDENNVVKVRDSQFYGEIPTDFPIKMIEDIYQALDDTDYKTAVLSISMKKTSEDHGGFELRMKDFGSCYLEFYVNEAGVKVVRSSAVRNEAIRIDTL